MRALLKILAVLVLLAGATILYGLAEARRDPVVRRATLPLADWPAGARPVRVLLISDMHLGSSAIRPERLARIVALANAERPDLVLLAGDFILGHDAATAARMAPDLTAVLSKLEARLGVLAVLGNHDYWTDAATVQRALVAARITVLTNQAVRRGPLVIGGVGDQLTEHADIPRTLTAMARLKGAKVIFTHGPDTARALRHPTVTNLLPPIAPKLILAGHTHCGQVSIPGFGPVRSVIDSRENYHCGLHRRGADRIVVTAGVGTSELPIRIGAPPDMWLVTLGPASPVKATPLGSGGGR